jgi:hypothetical protein
MGIRYRDEAGVWSVYRSFVPEVLQGVTLFYRSFVPEVLQGVTLSASSTSMLMMATFQVATGMIADHFHGQMNPTNFKKWTMEYINANFLVSFLAMMDTVRVIGGSCCFTMEKSSFVYEHNEEIQSHCCDRSHLTRRGRSQGGQSIQSILFSHKVIRLSPYVCEFCTLEFAWLRGAVVGQSV